MSFQSIKSDLTITRFFALSLLSAAFAILLSAQTVTAQCLESPTAETAVGLRNATSHFLIFYIDDLNKGGVPAGDQSVDFFVWPGEHTLRAEARIGDETVSVTRKVLVPVGYVCTWTVIDPPRAPNRVTRTLRGSLRPVALVPLVVRNEAELRKCIHD